MMPFVASHAVALSQAKREAGKSAANHQPSVAPRKGFFQCCSTLVKSRKRRAVMEMSDRVACAETRSGNET